MATRQRRRRSEKERAAGKDPLTYAEIEELGDLERRARRQDRQIGIEEMRRLGELRSRARG